MRIKHHNERSEIRLAGASTVVGRTWTKQSASAVCKMSDGNKSSGYSTHNGHDGKPTLSDRIRQIYIDDPPVYMYMELTLAMLANVSSHHVYSPNGLEGLVTGNIQVSKALFSVRPSQSGFAANRNDFNRQLASIKVKLLE